MARRLERLQGGESRRCQGNSVIFEMPRPCWSLLHPELTELGGKRLNCHRKIISPSTQMADILHKPPWLFYEEDEKMQNYIVFYVHFNSIKLFCILNRKALAWDQAFRPPRPLTFIEVMWGLYLLYAVIQLSKCDVPFLQMGIQRLKGFNMTWSIRPILELGLKSSQSDCKRQYFPTVWI